MTDYQGDRDFFDRFFTDAAPYPFAAVSQHFPTPDTVTLNDGRTDDFWAYIYGGHGAVPPDYSLYVEHGVQMSFVAHSHGRYWYYLPVGDSTILEVMSGETTGDNRMNFRVTTVDGDSLLFTRVENAPNFRAATIPGKDDTPQNFDASAEDMHFASKVATRVLSGQRRAEPRSLSVTRERATALFDLRGRRHGPQRTRNAHLPSGVYLVGPGSGGGARCAVGLAGR
jgi:hypothetical protein